MNVRLFAAVLALVPGLTIGLVSRAATPRPRACRIGVIEGEARAGQAFERPIGNGLGLLLEPIASGWIVRVLPELGPRGQHDFAELATPPYQSVSPLLIGTDFSFRAQDTLAWNPRNFRFAADQASFAELAAAYEDEMRLAKASPASSEAVRISVLRAAEARLAVLVSRMPGAQLTILDARLVEGTADQVQAAALVASHINRSARQVDQAADGRTTPLGQINWLRFRIRLELPASFHASPELKIERAACP